MASTQKLIDAVTAVLPSPLPPPIYLPPPVDRRDDILEIEIWHDLVMNYGKACVCEDDMTSCENRMDLASQEEELSEHPPYNKYGFVDHPQLQMKDQRNEFAPYLLLPQEGNMNGWLTDDANDLDLESTASNQPMSMTLEDTGRS
nr:hypothetical protein [Tanacetum cinerariifolium]